MTSKIPINLKEHTLLSIQSNTPFSSGCKLFTWTHNDGTIKHFSSIEFTNEYTAFISIKVKQNVDDDWRVLLKRFPLMKSPHGELGSNARFVFDHKQLLFMPRSIHQLRFILQQPSPIWKDFFLENVMITTQHITPNDRKPPIERLLTSALINDDHMTELTFPKTPPINELSQHLQALWAICAKMHQSDIGSDHIKRFDIDGNYDLQLLSYT